MRKILLFITLAMLLFTAPTYAQSFQVEKTFKAKVGDKKATSGMSFNDNDIINIDNNGYLVFVDTNNQKRYYVNHPCRSKVKNLIKKAQSPITVTKSFINAILSTPRTNTDYASAGSVFRGEDEELKPVDNDFQTINQDSLEMKNNPEAIKIDSNLIDGEGIIIYFVLP